MEEQTLQVQHVPMIAVGSECCMVLTDSYIVLRALSYETHVLINGTIEQAIQINNRCFSLVMWCGTFPHQYNLYKLH